MRDRPDLPEAWRNFIDTVCRELRIDRALEWLSRHLPGGGPR